MVDDPPPGYPLSQRARKRIRGGVRLDWTIAGQARTRLRGLKRLRWSFTLAAATYNLIRLPNPIAATPCFRPCPMSRPACPLSTGSYLPPPHLGAAEAAHHPRRRTTAPAAPFLNGLLVAFLLRRETSLEYKSTQD